MDEKKKKDIEFAIDELYFNKQIEMEEAKKNVLRIRYEEQLELLKAENNQSGLLEESLVMKVEDEQGNIQYEVYSLEDRENPIATVEQDGKISFSMKYLELLKERFGALYADFRIEARQERGEKINVDALEENSENVNENGEKKDIIEKNYSDEKERESLGEENEEKQESPKTEEEEKEQIEEDLEEQGIKGKITYIVDITDSSFYKEIPQAQKYKGIFSCAKFVCLDDGSSMVVGEEDGQYKPLEGLKQSSKKVENVSYISHDGTSMEEQQLRGLMTVEGDSPMAFSYKIGRFGEPEFSKLYFNKETGDYEFASPMETKKSYPVAEEVQEFMERKNAKELQNATKRKGDIEKTGRKIKTSNMAEISDKESSRVDGIYQNIVERAESQGKQIGREDENKIKVQIVQQLEKELAFSERMEQEIVDGLDVQEKDLGEERTIYSDAEERRAHRKK